MEADDDEIRPVPLVRLGFEPEGADIPYTGRILVLTESGSRYEIDLDLGLLYRIRGSEQPLDPEVSYPSKLRDHGRTVKILRVLSLAVGERAVFDIQSLGGPLAAYTRRTTTIVREIRPVQPDPEEREAPDLPAE
jgi:hypothetical protein